MRSTFETIVLSLPATLGIAFFLWRRMVRYMRYFQQEEYDAARFLRWFLHHRAYDSRGTLTAATMVAISSLACQPCSGLFAPVMVLGGIIISLIALREEDPRVSGKVRLAMTERARRTLDIACLLATISLALHIALSSRFADFTASRYFWGGALILVQLPPFLLIISNYLLLPMEKALQRKFLKEARERFAAVAPYTIGITGSFGKTSVKSYLGEILQLSLGPTFWTARSINTAMGVTRSIREQLRPFHRYAVMEMGAYREGSIKNLCSLTPPRAAIVTAVASMHLERFGSREAVFRAKSELPRALPKDGILICNGDDAGARRMAKEFPAQTTLLYGIHRDRGELDFTISGLSMGASGSEFTIHWGDASVRVKTKLAGEPAVSNILAAFAMAVVLGAAPEFVAGAIGAIAPVDNRLAVEKKDGVTFLKDAYNSNPSGFRGALDLLGKLPAKRRILFTPGMIELGVEQADENSKIGEYAAKVCSDVFVIGTVNKDALTGGLAKGGLAAEQIHCVPDRDSGFAALHRMIQAGDAVLIENDLTDLYEGTPTF